MAEHFYIVRDIRRNEYIYLGDQDEWSHRRDFAIEFCRYATASAKSRQFGGYVIEVEGR